MRGARILAACNYLQIMLKIGFKPCIPTKAAQGQPVLAFNCGT